MKKKAAKKPVVTSIKTYVDTYHERMIMAVINGCLDPANVAITNSVPAFAGYINTLNTNMELIATLKASISASFRGIAEGNQALKSLIATLTVNAMAATFSYAIDNGDTDLAGQMKYSTSDIAASKNTDFINFVQGAVNTINPMVGSLTNYSVTAAQLTSITSLLNTYSSQVVSPRNKITFRKTVNQEIQSTLKGCMDMLYNNCDPIAIQFRTSQVAYYNNYRSNRKLVDHTLSTQLRFNATATDGSAITRGEVFIIGTDRSAILDNNNGYVLVDQIPFGSYQVAFTNIAGTTTFGPYTFKKGKSLTLHVVISQGSSSKPVAKVTEEDLVEVTASAK